MEDKNPSGTCELTDDRDEEYDRLEFETIERINRGLNSLRYISSTGDENSLEHLLELSELSEFESPDEDTIEFVESFVTDPGEQKLLIEEDDDFLTEIENTGDDSLSCSQKINPLEEVKKSSEALSAIESATSHHEHSEIQSESSPGQSKYFFSNLFSTRRDSTSSSASSSDGKKTYLSRLFKRKKSEPASPVSNDSIPSCNSENDVQEVESSHLTVAEQLIQDTEAQGPAGTPHLSSLARVVGRPILAFSSSMSLRHRAGRDMKGPPVNIQFHSARPGMATGHWTLLENCDPEGIPAVLNNCLFNVVCAQTSRKPSDLRKETIREMRKHMRSLARRIQVMLEREECEGLIVLIGGASYSGRSTEDARRVIDDSQSGRCHPGHQQGHPRGHASYPGATGQTESAENYSRNGWKTGFLSRHDQDDVGHMALSTRVAQRAMGSLNQGSESQAVHISPSELSGSLPQAAEFSNGQQGPPRPIKQLVLVLRHHAGRANDPDYQVFVHTFYPKVT
ncbi:uncharacterized protein [Fopius arisanus]|uniref:Uncharacterized protein n=1 Tax=Fopius arisanus TaxID=64838 RepID=A0A9R1SX72_9HYME|nr:PREDICTED: uncharacterized protein LOC105263919 [Fopius arisanus]